MKPDRHQARILAMQMLCQLDAQGPDALEQLDDFLADSGAAAATRDYARRVVLEVWNGRTLADRRIGDQLEHWGLERLSPVERNVIRVGLFELARGEVPPKVAINEALEISREYGGSDSPRFVNGILDALWKAGSLRNGEPDRA